MSCVEFGRVLRWAALPCATPPPRSCSTPGPASLDRLCALGHTCVRPTAGPGLRLPLAVLEAAGPAVPPLLAPRLAALTQRLRAGADATERQRRPAAMQLHRPVPLRLFEPLIDVSVRPGLQRFPAHGHPSRSI